jgi:CRISPR-associated endoribonuclease Cas6
MRLLLKLRALKDQAYDLKYHHKLQGFIYSLLDGTPYVKLHDKRGYKFFCFSNIFPPRDAKKDPSKDMGKGEIRHLLISSPEVGLVAILNDRLTHIGEEQVPVNIGEMSFEVESVKAFEPRIGRSCRLITGTPIVLRIPREKFERYGIVPQKDYDYVYWKKEWPFEPFVKQLEENLFKKYREFYGKAVEESPMFEQFMFKKAVCNHVVLGGKEVKMFGSIWEFSFSYLDGKKRELLQFGLDAGFGEENSLGFGFMNVEIPRVTKR